jgi:hypothetical protein
MKPRGTSCIRMNGGIMRLTLVERFEMGSLESACSPAFISREIDFSGTLSSDGVVVPGREVKARFLSHDTSF